jgi:guanylate kinase
MECKAIVVIEGPSGVGKDSIISGLIKKYPDKFERIISVSTRPMRDYERQGNPYIFVTEEEFNKMLCSGDIFEHTVRHGTKRGMSEKHINAILEKGRIPLKDCDIYGVRALRTKFNNVLTFFITADKDEIETRIRKRGDREEDIIVRLKDYDRYITESKHYDYVIENKDLDKTIDKIFNLIYD